MKRRNEIISFPVSNKPNFTMIDVGRKRPTRRRAVACGTIRMNAEAFNAIRTGSLPKGNVLALAEAAGIAGAKKTPDLIPMCHTLPLDQVTIHCDLDADYHAVTVYAQAAAFAKTGVEMEALAGVNAALLTIWDLTKGTDPSLLIEGVRLLVKTGGKSGTWVNPEGIPDWLVGQLPDPHFLKGKSASILVMSDRASAGTYKDESGAILKVLLEQAGANLLSQTLIPDQKDDISASILNICQKEKPDLLLTSGGTGPGPKDVTPDALCVICDRVLEGLGDVLRSESLYFTDTAWLSRTTAGMVGATLVIALPGSPKAVQECWDVLSPFIGDALDKIKKQGFEVQS
ncbi:MAG: bifunctional molybdenum cofactor biosynthesis protein MoaC/MoaB [Alphaproteobacteria bacterium]|jgi:cyclic pyranopterin phosphate synthase|nr:bifunctional molybdenum cofactor biosynthesis protein MoaC/MoaB [Alphaproteobacteria bacterium]QQS57939.1 MAG: bifunctional molybdenum cofactor biosynthesis protein MoaC/MoaB [Alphaproteobacteria bacterium]